MTKFNHNTVGAEVVATFKERVQSKTFLITGPSHGGIGAETALSLAAASPALLLFAGRSLERIQPVIDTINASHPAVVTKYIPLDLSSQASVRKSAADINASVEKIDVMINNAAIMACPFAKTVDGIESQFGTNYLGHFLLTNLVMPKILAAGEGARIVNVSSSAHRMADICYDDLTYKSGRSYTPFQAYGEAKTAIILFSLALASRLRDKHIYSYSLNPGSIRTNLQKHMNPDLIRDGIALIKSNTGRDFEREERKDLQAGCSTTLVAALDPAIENQSGAYLEDCDIAEPEPYALDLDSAERLWGLSEGLVGENFVI